MEYFNHEIIFSKLLSDDCQYFLYHGLAHHIIELKNNIAQILHSTDQQTITLTECPDRSKQASHHKENTNGQSISPFKKTHIASSSQSKQSQHEASMTSLSCEHDWELRGAPDHANDMLPTGHSRRHVKTCVGSTKATRGCILKTQTSIEIWLQKNGHHKFLIIVKIG